VTLQRQRGPLQRLNMLGSHAISWLIQICEQQPNTTTAPKESKQAEHMGTSYRC
jgi:hypothetical protein